MCPACKATLFNDNDECKECGYYSFGECECGVIHERTPENDFRAECLRCEQITCSCCKDKMNPAFHPTSWCKIQDKFHCENSQCACQKNRGYYFKFVLSRCIFVTHRMHFMYGRMGRNAVPLHRPICASIAPLLIILYGLMMSTVRWCRSV